MLRNYEHFQKTYFGHGRTYGIHIRFLLKISKHFLNFVPA
jgi:hypothetical protein